MTDEPKPLPEEAKEALADLKKEIQGNGDDPAPPCRNCGGDFKLDHTHVSAGEDMCDVRGDSVYEPDVLKEHESLEALFMRYEGRYRACLREVRLLTGRFNDLEELYEDRLKALEGHIRSTDHRGDEHNDRLDKLETSAVMYGLHEDRIKALENFVDGETGVAGSLRQVIKEDARLEKLEATVEAMRARTLKVSRGFVRLGRVFDDRIEAAEHRIGDLIGYVDDNVPKQADRIEKLEEDMKLVCVLEAENEGSIEAGEGAIEDLQNEVARHFTILQSGTIGLGARLGNLVHRFTGRLRTVQANARAQADSIEKLEEYSRIPEWNERAYNTAEIEERIDKLEGIIKRGDFETGLETHAVDHGDLATRLDALESADDNPPTSTAGLSLVEARIDKLDAGHIHALHTAHARQEVRVTKLAKRFMDRGASHSKRIEALEDNWLRMTKAGTPKE